jgi:tRNA(Ile)-lysidine synthase TilS/MesJ
MLYCKKYDIKFFALAIDEGIKGYRDHTLDDLGEFCKKYNLSARRIKYWEEVGLFFPAVRSKGGVRLYKDSLIININFIRLFF